MQIQQITENNSAGIFGCRPRCNIQKLVPWKSIDEMQSKSSHNVYTMVALCHWNLRPEYMQFSYYIWWQAVARDHDFVWEQDFPKLVMTVILQCQWALIGSHAWKHICVTCNGSKMSVIGEPSKRCQLGAALLDRYLRHEVEPCQEVLLFCGLRLVLLPTPVLVASWGTCNFTLNWSLCHLQWSVEQSHDIKNNGDRRSRRTPHNPTSNQPPKILDSLECRGQAHRLL